MKSLQTLLVCFSLTACGGSFSAKVDKALDATNVALSTVDVVLDTTAEEWEKAVLARVEECRAKDLKTVQEKKDCLGFANESDEVSDAFSKLVEYQELLAKVLQGLDKVNERVGPTLDAFKGSDSE